MAHEGQPNDIATGNEFKLALAPMQVSAPIKHSHEPIGCRLLNQG